MPQHRLGESLIDGRVLTAGRRFRTSTRAVILATVIAVPAPVLLLGQAQAAPKPDIKTVREQVESLQEQVGATAEKYNAVREQLKTTTVQAKAAGVRVEQQQRQVDAGRRLIGRIAVEQYKAGDLSVMGTILSDRPQDTMAAAGLAVNLADRRVQAVNSLIAAQQKLVADQEALAGRRAALASQTKQLTSTRKEINAKLAERKRLLASLSAAQRTELVQLSSGADQAALVSAGVPAGTKADCGSVNISAPSPRVAAVIAFACAQLGEPYGWGAAGPGQWDCSGLTQAAWARAGVSLPHNARMQSGYGNHVSSSALQVGDLVYFSGYGHVGIYIGNGLMIHAPRTGDVVKISPTTRLGRIIDVTRL